MINKNNENLENSSNENESSINLENTSNELFENIATDFKKYFEKNKNNFSNSSLESIFLQYVGENEDFLNQIETKIGKKINFNDISNLYLKTQYTLEETLTKEIFKKFKRKNVVKSILRKFEEKIKEKANELGITNPDINFEQFLNNEITKNDQIDEIFKQVNQNFNNFLQNLNNNDKRQLKQVKIKNDDILTQLETDGILNEQELRFLKQDVIYEQTISEEKIKELKNIQTTLLNSNMINTLQGIKEKFQEIDYNLKSIGDLQFFGEILNNYKEIPDDKIDETRKKYQNEIETTYNIENPDNNHKKKQAMHRFFSENIDKYIKYIKTQEDENNHTGLADFLSTIKYDESNPNNRFKRLKENNIFDKIIDKYIENNIDKIANIYNLNTKQKQEYKSILQQLLKPSQNELTINQDRIDIEKTVKIGYIKNFDDILNLEPEIIFNIQNHTEFFSSIFPEYFVKIKGKNYSKFSNLRITKIDGNKIDGYIEESETEGKINVYKICPEHDTQEVEPKQTINIEDIKNIESNSESLELNSKMDLEKLVIGFLGVTIPYDQIKKEYAGHSLKMLDNEITEKDKEQTRIENKESKEDFNKAWDQLEGDENADFKEGTILQIRGNSLNRPGISHNWFYAEITKINQETNTFEINLGGGLLNFADENGEGNKRTLYMTKKQLINIKNQNNGNVFKFNKINNLKEFGENLKEIEVKSDNHKIKTGLSYWKNSIKIKDNKIVKINEKGEEEQITHIGKTTKNAKNKETIDCWEIEIQGNQIKISQPKGTNNKKERVQKTIDLNTFLIFFSQNQLKPRTESNLKDNEQIIGKKATEQQSGLNLGICRLKGFSIKSIVMSSKQIKDNFSYFFKENDELEAAQMYAKMANHLPSWGILQDIKSESLGEQQSKIWKRIENYKNRLERSGEGKGENHAKIAAQVIEKEIFLKIKSGKKLDERTRLKAAGYFIFAMEEGPHPYFRSLGEYAGKGYWIKALLGKEHHQKWSLQHKQLQENIRKDPNNANLKKELAMSEAYYMRKKEGQTLGRLFSEKFPQAIDKARYGSVTSPSKIKKAYEGESGKGNFFEIEQAMNVYMTGKRGPNAIGAFQALGERVDDQETYIHYYKNVISFVLTGYLQNNAITELEGAFKKVCRTYGIPIGIFGNGYNGIKKVMTILDYIVKKKGIKPGGNESLTKYLYGKDSPEQINVFELEKTSKMSSINSKLRDFWSESGEDIVKSLDYSDNILLNYKKEEQENLDQEQKGYISEYFGQVNEELSEGFTFNKDIFKTSYAPYYQENIFNVSAGPFGKIALSIDEGEFDSDTNGISIGLWNGLENRLEGMMSEIDPNNQNGDTIYEFVLQKYINWFSRYYKGEQETKLINAIYSGKLDKLNDIILENNRKQLGTYGGKIPYELENGLKQFVRFFAKKPKNIENILTEVFSKEKLETAKNYNRKT